MKIYAFALLIIVTLVLLSYQYISITYLYSNKTQIVKILTNFTSNKDPLLASDEWEVLNNDLVFRRSALFRKTQKFECLLVYGANVHKLNYKIDELHKTTQYASYLLIALFDLPKKYHDSDLKIYIFDENKQTVIQNPLSVQIKYERKLNKTAICSYQYVLREEFQDQFKQWLEMNRKIGYAHIHLFNHSIPSSYLSIVETYKDFLTISPYTQIPVFNSQNFMLLSVSRKDEFPDIYTQENFAYNECYLTYYSDYSRILVFDYDELIFPRATNDCTTTIDQYLTQIKHDFNLTQPFSYRFDYVLALHWDYVDQIFIKLDETLSKNQESIELFDSFLRISFKILTIEEKEYAQSILIKYKKLKNKIKINKNSIYDRLWMIKWIPVESGKSIHEFNHEDKVGHHYNIASNIKTVFIPRDRGYLIHFRPTPNLHNTEFNIKQLAFDEEYFNCFFST